MRPRSSTPNPTTPKHRSGGALGATPLDILLDTAISKLGVDTAQQHHTVQERQVAQKKSQAARRGALTAMGHIRRGITIAPQQRRSRRELTRHTCTGHYNSKLAKAPKVRKGPTLQRPGSDLEGFQLVTNKRPRALSRVTAPRGRPTGLSLAAKCITSIEAFTSRESSVVAARTPSTESSLSQ